MCDLCDPETRKNEQATMHREAANLEQFAAKLRAMAGGFLKPHTDDAKDLERRAEVAAREKAERAALRAERRRWREAYQWAKWGE